MRGCWTNWSAPPSIGATSCCAGALGLSRPSSPPRECPGGDAGRRRDRRRDRAGHPVPQPRRGRAGDQRGVRADRSPRPGGQIVVPSSADFQTLNPALAADATSFQLVENMYEVLVGSKPADGTLIPGCATTGSWLRTSPSRSTCPRTSSGTTASPSRPRMSSSATTRW